MDNELRGWQQHRPLPYSDARCIAQPTGPAAAESHAMIGPTTKAEDADDYATIPNNMPTKTSHGRFVCWPPAQEPPTTPVSTPRSSMHDPKMTPMPAVAITPTIMHA